MSITLTCTGDGPPVYSGPHVVTLPNPVTCPLCCALSPALQACVAEPDETRSICAPPDPMPAVGGYTLVCGCHLDTRHWRLRAQRTEAGLVMTLGPR